jgi:hypothetical protein
VSDSLSGLSGSTYSISGDQKLNSSDKKKRQSKEELIRELLSYKNDYVSFIEKFGRIRSFGLKPFKLFDFQKELVSNLQNFDFNIILKARQVGISTTVGAYLGTFIMFNPERDIVIIAINEDVAKELILKVKTFLTNLPKAIRPEIVNPKNKESVILNNGSRIMAMTSTSKSGRSFTSSFLVIDECAFVDKIEDLYTAAYPSISNGGRCILLSSPNGEGNMFHKIWTDSINNNNEFKPFQVMWWQYPGRDIKWKQRTLSNLGHDEKKFQQEYECSFLASSNSVISLGKINAILKRNYERKIEPIENFIAKSGKTYDNLKIYELPKPTSVYIITVDTAEGLGEERDASAFLITDITENKIIGEYEDKDINEKPLSRILFDVGETFNNALMIIELKSTGKLVASYLLDLKYKNVFHCDRSMSFFTDPNSVYNLPTKVGDDNKIVPGFITNSSNKVVLVNEMKNAIEEDEITEIYAKRFLEQLKTFVNKGGSGANPKYGAHGRNNDDVVIAGMLALYIKKYIWKIIENNNMLTQQVLEHFSRKITGMEDTDALTQTTAFSPIYNMNKFKKRLNPYIFQGIGDVRDLLK